MCEMITGVVPASEFELAALTDRGFPCGGVDPSQGSEAGLVVELDVVEDGPRVPGLGDVRQVLQELGQAGQRPDGGAAQHQVHHRHVHARHGGRVRRLDHHQQADGLL